MTTKKNKRRNDILLFVGVLVFGAILYFAVYAIQDSGGAVNVMVDGKVVADYSLDKNQKAPLRYNGYNLLEIHNGKARIIEADCPDKLCTQQRTISKNGETIVCLPHKTVIKVHDGDDAEFDGVIE